MKIGDMAALVLFDLDGTLIDHDGAARTAVVGIARRFLGPDAPADELVRTWSALTDRYMADHLAGRCSFQEQRRRRLREFLPLLGEEVPDERGLDTWFAEFYGPAYAAAWRAYPDVSACLTALGDHPARPRTAVLTNGEAGQQRAKLERISLLGAFETVLTPADLGSAKPEPATFTAACGRLGVEPCDTLSVGDWLEGDAIAAARAGLTGVWLDRGSNPVTGTPASGMPDAPGPASAGLAGLTGPGGPPGRRPGGRPGALPITRVESLAALGRLLSSP